MQLSLRDGCVRVCRRAQCTLVVCWVRWDAAGRAAAALANKVSVQLPNRILGNEQQACLSGVAIREHALVG
jgi:hypothetical protein